MTSFARDNSWLGYVPDLPDHRDFSLRITQHLFDGDIPVAANLSDRSAFQFPIYDQGPLGSCVGNATAAAMQYLFRKNKLPNFTPSRLAIYYGARRIEGSITSDAGCMIRDAIKVVVKDGVAPEALWPYRVNAFSRAPSSAYVREATHHQALVYERVAQDRDVLRRVVASGYPVIFGVSVFESFDTPETQRTGAIPYPSDRETMLGGHAMLMAGYGEQGILVRNSWGASWGAKGYCTMPWDYILNPDLAEDFWVIKSVER